MSVLTAPNPAKGGVRNWLIPLNLHWAGVGLLVLVNLYLLGHMALLWQEKSHYDAEAVAQQQIQLKAAEVAAMPLRGLDDKVELATLEADKFYKDRLPGSDSEMLNELGQLTKAAGVRFTGAQYVPQVVLPNSAGELTQVKIDARLSGDYRPLVHFINSLERDKMFFVINGMTLTGQQTGTVNLRLRLSTYLRGNAIPAGAHGESGANVSEASADVGGAP
jgi:type IV pilus assembly protein PilO